MATGRAVRSSGPYSILLATGDRYRVETRGHAILQEQDASLIVMTGLVSFAYCDLAAIAAVEFGESGHGSNGSHRLRSL